MKKMSKMTLGNTIEEKKATYELLTKNSKKWAKVFGIIGLICGMFIGFMMMGNAEPLWAGVIFGLVSIALMPITYYYYGQIYYYGFLVVRLYCAEKGIGGKEVVETVATSYLFTFIIGGRGAVKKLNILWFIIAIVAIVVSVYAGLYYYIKFQKEAIELGFREPFMVELKKSISKIVKKGVKE